MKAKFIPYVKDDASKKYKSDKQNFSVVLLLL